jgi:hypothetical protein
MSFRVVNRVRDHSRAEGSARLVLLVMASYADDAGHCHPNVATLAHGANLSRRAVLYNLQALRHLGELVPVVPGGGRWRATRCHIEVGPPAVEKGNGAIACTVSGAETVQPMVETVQPMVGNGATACTQEGQGKVMGRREREPARLTPGLTPSRLLSERTDGMEGGTHPFLSHMG